MTLGDTPKISFSRKCRKSLRIYNYGFCFRKWRSMTLPNVPGFCFQKWRSVRYPDFWLFSTLTFNIVTWWRHTCDVTSCTYTLTDTLSATYDVTVLSPCVTSQVTKIYFWILFPWMTLGENPKMLPIWVKGHFPNFKKMLKIGQNGYHLTTFAIPNLFQTGFYYLLNVWNDPKRSFEVIFRISEIMFRLGRNDHHWMAKFQRLL